MNLFSVLLKPTREDFVSTITKQEMEIVGQHFDYFKELLARNILLFAGRTQSGSFGLGLFQMETKENVIRLMELDPCVTNKIFTYTVENFSVALMDTEGLSSYAT